MKVGDLVRVNFFRNKKYVSRTDVKLHQDKVGLVVQEKSASLYLVRLSDDDVFFLESQLEVVK